MPGIYDALAFEMGGKESVVYPAAEGGMEVELRTTQSEGADGEAVAGIRLRVDGQDLLFADEDGVAGVYVDKLSWFEAQSKPE